MASSCFCGPLLGLRGLRGGRARAAPAAGAPPGSALLGLVLLGRRSVEPKRKASASQAELRSRLLHFLVKEARVSPKIVDYMTTQLRIESIRDFASYFTEKDYEAGVQNQIVAKIAPFSEHMLAPNSELQTSRLRTAWARAQSMDTQSPAPDKAAPPRGQPRRRRESGEAAAAEATPKHAARTKPTTIGYGITSNPVRGCSCDSLFAAMTLSVREPWRVMDVDRSSCSIQDCQGYIQRKMRLCVPGEVIAERIAIDRKASEFTFCKCGADGLPGETVRVLAIHTPLSLELYEYNTRTGLRVHWAAPFDVATGLLARIIKLAMQFEKSSNEMIGFGVASKPITGVSQDAVWEAMLRAMRNPAGSGLAVETVGVQGMDGYTQRTMRTLGERGGPAVTDNVRVIEATREITYRPVENGHEAEDEGVFALCSNPLRFEIFCRHSKDGTTLDWQAPRGPAISIFNAALLQASLGVTDRHAMG